MNRREMLKLGLYSGIAAGWELLPRSLLAYGYPAPPASSPPVTPFQLPLPIPPVLEPTTSTGTINFYDVTMSPNEAQIFPGYPPTNIWGYNGMSPGPTIKARVGIESRVMQTNGLTGVHHLDGSPVRTTVHLHGGRTPAVYDGHPDALIEPGDSFEHIYPNLQDATTLWYHDHQAHYTADNVYNGLLGFYLITDEVEESLNLPGGEFDIPIVIVDRLFTSDGAFLYPPLNQNTVQSGFLGDTIVVNGVAQPYFEVARRKYRFRFLNGSNARQYQLVLSNGQPFTQIGCDQGLLPAPVSRTAMRIAPAERLDVVIDFSDVPLGTSIELRNTLVGASDRAYRIMRFDVLSNATDTSEVPPTLRPVAPLTGASATRRFQLWFNGTNWTINGLTYNKDRVDFFPRLNSREVWIYQNFSPHPHPMHMHLDRFQVLRRFPGSPQPYEGWKDVINVMSGEELHIIVEFPASTGSYNFSGVYVHHCHNLEHEDHDMMQQFQTVP
jgi:spore coat protein A